MSNASRWTLIASILGSSMAFIDGSVVNVALHYITRDVGGGLAAQQWIVDAYLLTLGALILVGGSLGDIYGELRVFAIGVAAFGVASVLCAAAPDVDVAHRLPGTTGHGGRAARAGLARRAHGDVHRRRARRRDRPVDGLERDLVRDRPDDRRLAHRRRRAGA